jgi:hypothetical protein
VLPGDTKDLGLRNVKGIADIETSKLVPAITDCPPERTR